MAERANNEDTAREFIALGLSLLAQQEHTAAEQALSAALKLCPNATEAWAGLHDVLITLDGRKSEAREALLKSTVGVALGGFSAAASENISVDEDDDEAGPFMGGSGVYRGRFMPHDVPNDGKEEAIARARTAEASEDWQAAKYAWEEVVEIDPSDTWGWAQYAHLLSVHIQDYEKSEAAYRRAIEEDPTDDWAHGKLGIMIADFLGRVEEGQELLHHAIDLDASEPFYHGWLGWSLYRQSENYAEAEGYLRTAVELMPEYHWAWFHLSYVCSMRADGVKEAVKGYETAIELQPTDSSSHFNLGVLYQDSQEREKKAVKCFEVVTKLTPDDAAAWRRLGALYTSLYEEKKAITAYLKHNEINDENDEVWANMGHIYAQDLLENDLARDAYEKALALNDQNETAHCLLADLLHLADEEEQAELHYECAVALAPDYAYALQKLIDLKMEKKAPEAELQPLFDSWLEIDGDQAYPNMRYCRWVGHQLEKTIKGRDLYLKALKQFPSDESLLFQFFLFTGVYSYCFKDLTPYIDELLKKAEDISLLSGLVASYYSIVDEDDERAEVWINRMVELDSEEHYALHTAAEFYLFRALEVEKARGMLEQAKAVSNECSPLPAHQALIAYFIDGDKAAAHDFLAESVKIDLEDEDDLPCDEALIIAYAEGRLDEMAEGARRLIEDDADCVENYIMLMLAIEHDPECKVECAALMKQATKVNIADCDIDALIAWFKAPLKTQKPY